MPSWLFKAYENERKAETQFFPYRRVEEDGQLSSGMALQVSYDGRARAYASISAADMDRLCEDWQQWKAARQAARNK